MIVGRREVKKGGMHEETAQPSLSIVQTATETVDTRKEA